MLRKDNKQIAEQITNELMPCFLKASKLGEKLTKASKETRHADTVARAWHWCSAYECEQAGENLEEIKRLKSDDLHKWSEILDIKRLELHQKEHIETLARINYHNYLLFIAKLIAYKLRVNNTWALFYDKKGIESLNKLINAELKNNNIGLTLSIYRDGGSMLYYPINDKNFYMYLNIKLWGCCGVVGTEWGTFRNRTIEDNEKWKLEKPTEPQALTLARYNKLLAKMKEYEKQAKQARETQYNIANNSGLIYYHETMQSITTKKWEERE